MTDIKNHDASECCHICGDEITGVDDKTKGCKVSDHCHVSGMYRGAAHYNCNLRVNYNNIRIQMFAHSAKGYDNSLIISNFQKYIDKKEC